MARLCLVNFATPEFYDSQQRLNQSVLQFGITEVRSYAGTDIRKTAFYRKNRWVLGQKRCAGYCLWKPYIILDAMANLDAGDMVIYLDSDIEVLRDLAPLVELCEEHGQVLFNAYGHFNRTWTKRDCFVLTGCDAPEYYDASQVLGGMNLWRKDEASIGLLREWLTHCEDRRIVTDLPNSCGLENLPEFKEHRHDQSVLSLLAARRRLELFRDPSQFGNSQKLPEFRDPGEDGPVTYATRPMENSRYPTLFKIHFDIDRTGGIKGRVKRQLKKILFR